MSKKKAHKRQHKKEEKKPATMMPKILGGILLLVIAAVAFFFLSRHEGDLSKLPAINKTELEPQVYTKLSGLIKTVEANPNNAVAWGKLGMNLYIHGYEPESIPCYQEANLLDSKAFRWPYFCGYALEQQKDSSAAEWYARSVAIDEKYPPAHVRYGNALLAAGNYADADAAFQKALSFNNRLSHAYVGLGASAYEQEKTAEAITHLEKAIAINSAHREAYPILINCYRATGNIAKVEAYAARMAKYDRKLILDEPIMSELTAEGVSAYWYRERAKGYMRKKVNDRAAAEFAKYISLSDTKDGQIYHDYGIVLTRLNKLPEAVKQLEKAVEYVPDNPPFLSNLGSALCRLQRCDEGSGYLKKAHELAPDYQNATTNLAGYYTNQGNWAEAVAVYEQSANAAPDNSFFSFHLAWLLATVPDKKVRDGDKALQISQSLAVKSRRQEARVLDLLAAAYAETGDFPEAAMTVKEAIGLAKTDQKLIDTLKRRLKNYEAKTPWRVRVRGS